MVKDSGSRARGVTASGGTASRAHAGKPSRFGAFGFMAPISTQAQRCAQHHDWPSPPGQTAATAKASPRPEEGTRQGHAGAGLALAATPPLHKVAALRPRPGRGGSTTPSPCASPATAGVRQALGPFSLYPRVGPTNHQCLRTAPDDSPRSPRTSAECRRGPCARSPAPRSGPGHPSARPGGRWSGARGPGARSGPWQPPPAGREERAGVELGPESRKSRSRPLRRLQNSVARSALDRGPGSKAFETPGAAARTRTRPHCLPRARRRPAPLPARPSPPRPPTTAPPGQGPAAPPPPPTHLQETYFTAAPQPPLPTQPRETSPPHPSGLMPLAVFPQRRAGRGPPDGVGKWNM